MKDSLALCPVLGFLIDPKDPNLESQPSRLIFSISLEENFNLDLQNSPQKQWALVGGSLELFNLA